MKDLPLVSVIIPVYNGSQFLEEALQSVYDQTYSNVEIIVVDDGSTDTSSDIVEGFSEVRYFYQENQGVSVARNTGIQKATGAYIAFLDADDIWMPEKLSIQIEYMLKHPEYRITTTEKVNFLEPGTELPDFIDKRIWETMGPDVPSTMVVEKSLFEEVGHFSPDYKASEDIEWLKRAGDMNVPFKMIEYCLVRRRFHGDNLSWELADDRKSRMMRIMRESIARKKSQAAGFGTSNKGE